MKEILVREWMTANPQYTYENTRITQAHETMKNRDIRRLPVLRSKKLVGIVTLTDIRRAMPSDVTSLSVHELNYLLDKVTVEMIMTKEVLTIGPENKVSEAAQIMLDNKIGGLPVIDANENLVGIISESDIFRIVASEPEEIEALP
jgi:acetoin utilization protein AcuB